MATAIVNNGDTRTREEEILMVQFRLIISENNYVTCIFWKLCNW